MMTAEKRVKRILEQCRRDKDKIGTFIVQGLREGIAEATSEYQEMLGEAERQITEKDARISELEKLLGSKTA